MENNINKFNSLEKTLQDRIKLAKEAAMTQVTLFHNNPSLSPEDRVKSFSETREDVRLGAEVSGLSKAGIEEVLRAFDVEAELLKQGLEEDDEKAQDERVA